MVCAERRRAGERAIQPDPLDRKVAMMLYVYGDLVLNRAHALHELFIRGSHALRWRDGDLYQEDMVFDLADTDLVLDAGHWPLWRSDELPEQFEDVEEIMHSPEHRLMQLPNDLSDTMRAGIIEMMRLVIIRGNIAADQVIEVPTDHPMLTGEDHRDATFDLIDRVREQHGKGENIFGRRYHTEALMRPRKPNLGGAFSDVYNRVNAEAACEYLRSQLGLSSRELLANQGLC